MKSRLVRNLFIFALAAVLGFGLGRLFMSSGLFCLVVLATIVGVLGYHSGRTLLGALIGVTASFGTVLGVLLGAPLNADTRLVGLIVLGWVGGLCAVVGTFGGYLGKKRRPREQEQSGLGDDVPADETLR